MEQAKIGDKVRVHFTGRVDVVQAGKSNQMVFESSKDRQPLEFELGQNQVISGLEQAIIGMEPGQTKTVEVPPSEAFGPRREELVARVERNQLGSIEEVKPGMQLELKMSSGQNVKALVVDVDGDQVKLDANHPLAGKDLQLDLELVEIL